MNNAERPERKFPAPPRRDAKLHDKLSRILIPIQEGEVLKKSRPERAVPSKTPSAPSKAVRKKAWDAGTFTPARAEFAHPAASALPRWDEPQAGESDEARTTAFVRALVHVDAVHAVRSAQPEPEIDEQTLVDAKRVRQLVNRGKKLNTGKRGWTDESITRAVPTIHDETASPGRTSKRGDATARAVVERNQKARARAKKWAVTERPAGTSDADWELFALIERDGLTGPEAAARLGLKPTVARKRLQRVREEIEWQTP